MLLDWMHHPRRSTPDDRACPPRRPRRNSLVSLHESLRQAGLPSRRGSDRPQGVDRASARRTCSSLRASCPSSAIQGSRLDSFVASRFALSHDFPPAQAPNFRRFAAQSVKWAVGQFGTIPALFSPRCRRSARVSMAANEVLARVADVASSDLLDFIVELAHRLLHRQPSSAQILTADSVQQPPIAAPGGSEINHGIHRNPRKRESESTPPFQLPLSVSVGAFRGYPFVMIFLAGVIPLRYRRHRDRRGVRQGRPADAEACHRRLPTSSEGL